MKPGSYLINTARAEIVDAAALVQAVQERQVRVGLDVFRAEPPGATGDFADAQRLRHPSHINLDGAPSDERLQLIKNESSDILDLHLVTL